MKKNLLKKAIISLVLITTIVGGVSSMNDAKALVVIDNATEKWEMGVGTNFYVCFWQYSNYWRKSNRHYANAMMNNKYSGRKYANANKWAKADSPEAWGGYDDHRSYYGNE